MIVPSQSPLSSLKLSSGMYFIEAFKYNKRVEKISSLLPSIFGRFWAIFMKSFIFFKPGRAFCSVKVWKDIQLFNEKFDLDLSESEWPLYFNYKKERKTLELINKKEELKQAFSDIIPEDMYFSLD